MEFVCPQPQKWNEIHQSLKTAWEQAGSQSDVPPIPLILNGWVFSSDFEKKQRWQNTIAWAQQHDCSGLIPELTEDERYFVAELN